MVLCTLPMSFYFNFNLCYRFFRELHLKLIPGIRPLYKKHLQIDLLEFFLHDTSFNKEAGYIPVARFFVRNFVARDRNNVTATGLFSETAGKMVIIYILIKIIQ